jgi:hypothetical protein
MDTIRGHSKGLYSNLTSAEQNDTSINAFNPDGFTVNGNGDTNQSSQTFVGWSWKAGGNKNTFNVDDVGYVSAAAAGLTGGTIALTGASVGTRQGFSIVTYTGTNSNAGGTVPHGLGKPPELIFAKSRTTTNGWVTYTKTTGKDKYLLLHSNGAAQTSSGVWGSSEPTNTVFGTDSSHPSGNNDGDIVAYLWHSVPGLQKFGSYTGGGSSYPFIELGFSPAILMIKDASTGGTHYDWKIIDSTRNPFNLGADNADSKNVLFPNLSDAENKGGSAWAQCDFLSNGFRMNDQSVTVNNSGSTYIYAAWAEAPTFNLFGGQSNAF